jgi:hypothetical protein
MVSAEHLKTIVKDVTPALEKVLATDSLTSKIPESLQLRYTQCGLGTAALQRVLLDEYDIPTDRQITRLEEAPRGLNFRIGNHVILRAGDQMIDPTYGQFMNYVGLTHRSAVEHDIAHLYPPRKIMVYGVDNARAFANTFAEHAYNIDRSGLIPRPKVELEPDGALRGASLEEMQRVYQSIWNPDNYEPFPVTDQDKWFQGAAEQAAESTKLLMNSSR